MCTNLYLNNLNQSIVDIRGKKLGQADKQTNKQTDKQTGKKMDMEGQMLSIFATKNHSINLRNFYTISRQEFTTLSAPFDKNMQIFS